MKKSASRRERPARQADEWLRLVPMWLHGKPQSTRSVYEPEIKAFRKFIGTKAISRVTLADLQGWADSLAGDKPRTVARKLSTIKSLLTFCFKTGNLRFNVGAALTLPKIPDDLAEKFIEESDVAKIIEHEPNARNNVLLRLMYMSGVRAAEIAGLRWTDVQARNNGEGQITVLGKGNKTRPIWLKKEIFGALVNLCPDDFKAGDPVFPRHDGKHLSRITVTLIVNNAARRVGPPKVSAHWLRHAHATHSLEHGAPLPLIQRTLGHSNIATTGRYLHARPNESSGKFLWVKEPKATKRNKR